ncbi:MAG: M42 family peptidase [Oscillospiraceae bacterium]|jgi:putative aminopeptidase FrvX
MRILEILKQLCDIGAPSGFERPVAEQARLLLEKYMDETRFDVMGNLIGVRRCGRPEAISLLLDAHLDEIGLIVTGIDGGFLRFAKIGGVDPRMLPARRVKILTSPPRLGVIATMPPHVLSSEDMDKSIEEDKLVIDVGLSGERAKELIPLGTPVVFEGSLREFGEGMVFGKALDDRACFAIILRALELLEGDNIPVDLWVMGSAQEEVGMRGAKTGVFAADPHYCVAVDVTHAGTPDSQKERTLKTGFGPAIGVGPNMNRDITGRLVSIAKEKNIPYQIEAMGGGSGTNGWVMQVSRSGVSTAVVSLPIKYMHSPVETALLEDAENCSILLAELVRSMEVRP